MNTIEYEHNRSLSFSDLKLNIINNRIVIDWFQKKTFSGRFLAFISKHLMSQDRHHLQPGRQDSAPVTSYLSPKNLELIMEILSDNSYRYNIQIYQFKVKKTFQHKTSNKLKQKDNF